MKSAWSEQSIETLKGLLASGISGGLIAERMGISRSAVSGKAARLNLTIGAGKPIRMSQEDRQARKIVAQRQRRGTQPTNNGSGNLVLRINGKATQVLPANFSLAKFNATIPPDQRVTIEGLTHATCRFPVSDDPWSPEFFYCAALEAENREGRPYCRIHAGFAFTGKSSAKPWLAGRP